LSFGGYRSRHWNLKVKLTFALGATPADPAGVFNMSLDGDTRQVIKSREGKMVDEGAFVALIGADEQVSAWREAVLRS